MFNNQYILNLGGKISQKEFLAIILCYLFGLLHWVLFINYNNPSYTYADWAFFKQLLGITGYAFQHNEIPFHVELFVGETEQLFDQTFQTYRYFGKPWVTAPPQIFLLKFVDFHVYITLQGVIFYTLGFIRCYKRSERLSLPLVSTVLLLILFQLNGAIVSRMGIGHPNIAYGLMLIPWIFLILYDFVHERDQCKVVSIFLFSLNEC